MQHDACLAAKAKHCRYPAPRNVRQTASTLCGVRCYISCVNTVVAVICNNNEVKCYTPSCSIWSVVFIGTVCISLNVPVFRRCLARNAWCNIYTCMYVCVIYIYIYMYIYIYIYIYTNTMSHLTAARSSREAGRAVSGIWHNIVYHTMTHNATRYIII